MEYEEAHHNEHNPLIEAILECAPVIDKMVRLLVQADRSDISLRDGKLIHPYRRRFVIEWPDGSQKHPYSHRLLELQPRKDFERYENVRKLQLRFATTEMPHDIDQSESARALNGKVVVTVSYGKDVSHELNFLLTDHSWGLIKSNQDLIIENGELRDVEVYGQPTIYSVDFLSQLIDDFEPIPHINQE